MPDSRPREAHLIIGYTPYHALMAESIIKQVSGKIHCIFTKRWPKGDYIKGCSWSNKSRTAKIISLAKAAAAIKKIYREEKNLNIYIPHPSHPLGNYAFFGLKNCKTFIYEDGIMNYYDAASTQPSLPRIILSKAFLIPYRSYKGHLSGIDARKVDGVYLTRPERAVKNYDSTRKIQTSLPRPITKTNSATLLFLSQDVSSRIPTAKAQELLQTVESLAESEGLEILEKRHHDQQISNSGFREVNPEHRQLPAEALIEILSPKIVVSYFSSALINIKQLNPEIKCIALAAREISITINGEEKHLSYIFLEAGVEC